MGKLQAEMMRSLNELNLGFKGELSMSDEMEALLTALALDRVPAKWAKSYPTKRSLGTWLFDLNARLHQVAVVPDGHHAGDCAEEPARARQAFGAYRHAQEDDRRRGGYTIARRCIHCGHADAGRALRHRHNDRRPLEAEGDVLCDACDELPCGADGKDPEG